MKFDNLFNGMADFALPLKRERHLAARLKRSPKAREALALESMWESVVFLRSCACSQITNEELFSLSWDGLTRAVKNYQPRDDFRFFTYAKCYLRGNLKRSLKMRGVVRNATGHESLDNFQNEAEFHQKTVEPMTTDFDFGDFTIREEMETLREVAKKLPPADRQLLELKFTQHLNNSEIAGKRGVTRQAIDVSVRRVLKKLRCLIKLEAIRRGIS